MTAGTVSREGMPTHEGDMSIEARGMEPIPEDARYGSVGRIFTVWFTPNLVPAAFVIGTFAAANFINLGFWTSLAAIIVGNLAGSVLVGILGQMGPRTGMAQMPAARLAYGKSIVLPGVLNWLSCIGWDGINSVFGAAAIALLTGLPFPIALLIIVLAQGALGVIGYEGIHTFEKYMAVVLAVMFAILTVAIIPKAASGIARVDGVSGADQLGAFVLFAAIVASFVLAWALYASDYSRYLPANTPGSKIFTRTVLGLSLSAGWIELLGLLVANQVGDKGAVAAINGILGGGLLGALAMIAIAVGTIAVNAMNDYTGSLSLQAAGLRLPRVYSAVAVAILGFLFTLYLNSGDFVAKFESYLLFISYWIAPWAAVVVVDWWQRGKHANVSGLTDFARLPSGLLAVGALIVGFVVSLPFQQSVFGEELRKSTGLPINAISDDLLHYADFAYIVGFLVAAAVFLIGSRVGATERSAEPVSAV
jgi:NCS1 family nucleobase:cation symporter-1